MFLGMEGFTVFLAYALTIGSALLCVVYGLWNWNRPTEDEQKQITEELEWEKHDPELADEGAQK